MTTDYVGFAVFVGWASAHQRCRGMRRWWAEAHPTLAICVLPDHLHCIWQLPVGDRAYPQRWAAIKARFSRGLDAVETRSDSKVAKREKGIWQRRYWEHQIRDELDLQRHVDYIHMNPVKHGLVAQVRDWPHSSFHRYVKESKLPADWGGIDSGYTVPE